MKIVLLTDLMRCPQMWHELIPYGTLRGGELLLSDELARKLDGCKEPVEVRDWIVKPAQSAGRPNAVAKFVARSPRLVKWLQRHRIDGERGVGDTLARLLGGKDGKQFAAWFAALGGRTCGCKDAQEWLNTVFPAT